MIFSLSHYQIGDPLVKLNKNIDWEIFSTPIETNMHKDRSKDGRPPYDAILMFKIVMLQQLYHEFNSLQLS
jgi:hypothetical protein